MVPDNFPYGVNNQLGSGLLVRLCLKASNKVKHVGWVLFKFEVETCDPFMSWTARFVFLARVSLQTDVLETAK